MVDALSNVIFLRKAFRKVYCCLSIIKKKIFSIHSAILLLFFPLNTPVFHQIITQLVFMNLYFQLCVYSLLCTSIMSDSEQKWTTLLHVIINTYTLVCAPAALKILLYVPTWFTLERWWLRPHTQTINTHTSKTTVKRNIRESLVYCNTVLITYNRHLSTMISCTSKRYQFQVQHPGHE